MKGLRLISVFLMLTFFLGACRASGGDAAADLAEPKLRITAPFDFLADTPELTADLDMNIVDDYALIIDPHEGTSRHSLYYASHSSGYGYITIFPEIMETDIQNRVLAYETRTNFGGLFSTYKLIYAGKHTAFDSFILWCGDSDVPEEDRVKRPERCWIDLVVKVDETVVGMVVLEIVDWYAEFYQEGTAPYGMTIEYKYSEYYPLVDGQPQNITEDFAWQRVEAYHQYEEQKTQ